jgi:hypothetical protein
MEAVDDELNVIIEKFLSENTLVGHEVHYHLLNLL